MTKKLNTIRLPFYKIRSVGGFKEESQHIFELLGDYVYLLCSDGCENPYDDDLINHKLYYYLNPETYMPYRNDSYISYFNPNC
jgi:hypothetical protein